LIYRIDEEEIVIVQLFAKKTQKKTQKTSQQTIKTCKSRLKAYDNPPAP